jgi:uncharacterized cupin superfamily protein
MEQPNQPAICHLLKVQAITLIPEVVKIHPLNPQAVRHIKSLSDAVGMTSLGIHLVRVEPGKETTEFHFHHHEEEFIYILSGKGIAEIGEIQYEVEAGDFMGFTARSVPHCMRNPFNMDLVYLMGGERSHIDICDYPRLRKRLISINDEHHLVELQGTFSVKSRGK